MDIQQTESEIFCKIMECLPFLIDLNRIYIHQSVTYGQLSNYDNYYTTEL